MKQRCYSPKNKRYHRFGLPANTIRRRLRKGWSVKQALTTSIYGRVAAQCLS